MFKVSIPKKNDILSNAIFIFLILYLILLVIPHFSDKARFAFRDQ